MGEYAPKAIKDAFPIIDREYGSAKFSGILSGGSYGYHVSRNRLRAMGKTGDYSIQAGLDREGDGDAGSGLDVSLNDADMKLATRRLMDACEAKDPRVQGKLREFFGTLDGKTVTGYSPYRGRRVSADKSHLWHIHLSGHRKWATNAEVWAGIAEVMAGIPLNDVEPGTGAGGGGGEVPPKPKPKPKPYKPAAREIYVDKLHKAAERKPQNSDSVYWWQRILNAISFPDGKEIACTGDWSAETTAETKKAQKSIGDTQDGWPGPKQIEHFAELAKREVGALSIYRDSDTGGLLHRT